MPLYTFFFEYDRGTYISQIVASSYRTAPNSWAKKFDLYKNPEYKKYFERGFEKRLQESIELNLCSPIDSVVNTWAFETMFSRPSLLHYTQTAVKPFKKRKK
jgi:hypothetical protein